VSARKVFALAVAACAAIGQLATTVAAPSQTWVATHTQAVHPRGIALGAAPARQALRISVSLPLRNKADIDRLIVAMGTPGSAQYGKFLKPAQVLQRFGPSSAQVARVVAYMKQNGFTNISVASNRLLVDGTATVAQAEHAFNTSIGRFRLDGRTIFANVKPAMVPSTLARDVVAVLGLSNMPMHSTLTTKNLKTAAGSPDFTGFSPMAIQHAYDADKMSAATGIVVSIMTQGDMTPTIRNLRKAEKAWHYPEVPVSVVYGTSKDAITDDNPATDNLEWDLDMQMSTLIPRAVKKLVVYDVGTFTDPEVARGINLFVSRNEARAMSVSLGECDFIAFLDGAMITTDEALAEGAIQGQSMFSGTGDNGFACPYVAATGFPGGVPNPSWPSTGEYVTAAGGTTLIADNKGDVQQEIGWIGGGGGISPWETAAPWTLRANPAGQSWQYTNQGGRSVPDVSAVADGNTGVIVYGSGGPTVVGGTSVSGPLIMGLWARVLQARNGNAGLASFSFYRLYNKTNPGTVENPIFPVYAPAFPAKAVAGFRDIVVGTNGLYVDYPGYDYVTGIGVLDTATLAKKL